MIAAHAYPNVLLMPLAANKKPDMGKHKRCITRALCLVSLSIFFFCGAEDGQEIYPVIERLDFRDKVFKQLLTEVEANRKRVFNLEKSRNDSVGLIAESFTIYQYTPKNGEDILFLAARLSIPYSTLASFNRINNTSAYESGKTLLLPTAPGIFIPETPQSDLEQLLASSRFSDGENEYAEIKISGQSISADTVLYYFPGSEYNSTERAFFLNTGFRFPLRSYRLTSSFGIRRNPVTQNIRMHEGIDLAAPQGTEVYAAGNGIVTEAGFDPIYGNYVIIKHENNWASLYGHLQRIGISLKSSVKAGTIIGWVGTTGQSTGPHLHFELRQNGKARDPDKYLFMPNANSKR